MVCNECGKKVASKDLVLVESAPDFVEPFCVGDICYLASGSPAFAMKFPKQSGIATVSCIYDGMEHLYEFPLICLRKAKNNLGYV